MQRLLLADGTGNFIKPIMQQLKNKYSILSCSDDHQVLSKIQKFDPDIMVLDLQLPGAGGLSILRGLRSAGMTVRVIAITPLSSPHILNELASLDVSCVHLTTVRPAAVAGSIFQISEGLVNGEEISEWDPAVEVDKMLLDLSFCMGKGGYSTVREAILYLYRHPECHMMKCLYLDLAAMFRTSVTQVEKAIRDVIKDAWAHSGTGLWRLYLHRNGDLTEKCPSNEMFLAYAAHALRCRKQQSDKSYRIAE